MDLAERERFAVGMVCAVARRCGRALVSDQRSVVGPVLLTWAAQLEGWLGSLEEQSW